MSLVYKLVHVRLTPKVHDRLSVIAGLSHDDIAEHAAYLLEKTIVAVQTTAKPFCAAKQEALTIGGVIMSLDRKSVHVRLTPEIHDRLSVIAGLNNDDIAEHAAYLLEKTIVAEWHVINVQAKRMQRLGLIGIDREREGS